MPFDPAERNTPGVPYNRVIEFHVPGGLRVGMMEIPTNDVVPYEYEDFPYTDQRTYGSGDYGESWTEVRGTDGTYENIVAPPTIDQGLLRMRFPTFCGNGKVVAHAVDVDGNPQDFIRLESNDYGTTWTTKPYENLTITAATSSTLLNNQMQPTYTGDGEVFVIRPSFNAISQNSNKRGGIVYKSTDYADETWEQVGIINAWNCRGITYIGRDALFDRKMFLCVGDLYSDGTYNETVGYCPAVWRSVDNGATWQFMEWIDNSEDAPSTIGDGWGTHAYFAYLGDGVVLLNTHIHGTTHNSDACIFRSSNYGRSWTKIFTFPVSEYVPTFSGSPATTYQYSWGLVYCGKRRTEKNYIPFRYHEYVYAWVNTANALAQGHLDQYLSDDGGYSWKRINTLPQWQETNTNGYEISYWLPSSVYLIEDNEAIPGLYT